MDLSVAIVNWNTRHLLDRCLKSVSETTDGIEFEVIVVDNASTDGSAAMVREKWPRVKLIENKENLGFARANNQAYEISSGRHFMMLNPDTVVMSNPAAVVSYLDTNGLVGAVGCKCLNPDGSIQQNWCDYYPGAALDFLPEKLRNPIVRALYRRAPDSTFETKWVGGQCMTVKRKCIDEVGVMDAGYFMYTEETDWCFRIRAEGWKVCHCPEMTIVHLGGQSTKQDDLRMLVELYRSKTRFIRRNKSALESSLFKMGLWLRTLAFVSALAVLPGRKSGAAKRARLLHLLRSIARF
jgi:N-acetylglucosaminyl-diphospho-decaprenol L-rhamnosyltransferase